MWVGGSGGGEGETNTNGRTQRCLHGPTRWVIPLRDAKLGNEGATVTLPDPHRAMVRAVRIAVDYNMSREGTRANNSPSDEGMT